MGRKGKDSRVFPRRERCDSCMVAEWCDYCVTENVDYSEYAGNEVVAMAKFFGYYTYTPTRFWEQVGLLLFIAIVVMALLTWVLTSGHYESYTGVRSLVGESEFLRDAARDELVELGYFIADSPEDAIKKLEKDYSRDYFVAKNEVEAADKLWDRGYLVFPDEAAMWDYVKYARGQPPWKAKLILEARRLAEALDAEKKGTKK